MRILMTESDPRLGAEVEAVLTGAAPLAGHTAVRDDGRRVLGDAADVRVV
jgi:hypothetical protein